MNYFLNQNYHKLFLFLLCRRVISLLCSSTTKASEIHDMTEWLMQHAVAKAFTHIIEQSGA